MNNESTICLHSNKQNGTLYTGVTSELMSRILKHKLGKHSKFTKRYNCKMLVYYELYETMKDAIQREKQIKNISRAKKINLIETMNPTWKDLSESTTI